MNDEDEGIVSSIEIPIPGTVPYWLIHSLLCDFENDYSDDDVVDQAWCKPGVLYVVGKIGIPEEELINWALCYFKNCTI